MSEQRKGGTVEDFVRELREALYGSNRPNYFDRTEAVPSGEWEVLLAEVRRLRRIADPPEPSWSRY